MVPRRPQDTDVVKEAGAWQRTKEGKPRVMAERGQGSEKALKGTEEEAKKRGQECRVADGSGSPKVKGGEAGEEGGAPHSFRHLLSPSSFLMQPERLRARAGVMERKCGEH